METIEVEDKDSLLDCPGCFGRGYTYGPTNVYPSTEAQEEPETIDCPVCHGTGKKPNAQIIGGTPSDESGCSAIEYAIAKARDNAGKFISDAAMNAFIEELKK